MREAYNTHGKDKKMKNFFGRLQDNKRPLGKSTHRPTGLLKLTSNK